VNLRGLTLLRSLDVKQKTQVIIPEPPVVGARKVTLRYDRTTGEASLHDGGLPLKAAFCEGKVPAGCDSMKSGSRLGGRRPDGGLAGVARRRGIDCLYRPATHFTALVSRVW
jgi:hypothetical protein